MIAMNSILGGIYSSCNGYLFGLIVHEALQWQIFLEHSVSSGYIIIVLSCFH